MANTRKATNTMAANDGVYDPMEGYEPIPPFKFKGIDGEVYEAPSLSTITLDHLDELEGLSEVGQLLHLAGNDAEEALKKFPQVALVKLVEAWLAHSEVTPGESSGSQD